MNQTHTLCKRPAQQPHTALMGTQCTMSVPAHLDIDPLDTLHTPAVLCQNLLYTPVVLLKHVHLPIILRDVQPL